jgi:hypothetical protein
LQSKYNGNFIAKQANIFADIEERGEESSALI